MGFEPGGRADKFGNRHESRWVVKQLLRLLNEEINSVVIESIGDDEKGVDLWVKLKNGTRQAQQCKARNKSKELWSINDLKTKGILNHLQFQLDRDPGTEFVFVSGIPARLLGDICDSARNSTGSPEDFYRYQIRAIGKERRDAFRDFCKALNLNPEDETDRAKSYNYLRRTRFELYPDDNNTRRDLLATVGFLLTGNPETVVATLSTYAENNDRFGTPIYPDKLRDYLGTHSVYPKQLAHDTRIAPAIEHLRREFDESIRPGLINGNLMKRKETEEILKVLEANGLVVLHGPAGSGKSGVLYELACDIKEKNIPYLPLRLDRRIPEKTAAQFGCDIGLPDSPVNCLVALAGERPCVLILDQLDAIRWTSTHSANALDVCKELIRQVLSFRSDGKSISVVLSCRTFDLEHDPEIRNWLDDRCMPQWTKLEVRFLPETSVRAIAGTVYEEMNGRQKLILSNPQNLAMWVELRNQGNLPPFSSATELMKRFWEIKREQMELNGASVNDINSILGTLVNWLEANGKVSAPIRILSFCSINTLNLFKSLGIIYEQNNKVSFCHQSYLDFLIAEHLVNEIETGGRILNWLGPKERQTLFRRGQLQQALILLAEESPDRFLASVREILSADGVRFHLKHLILETTGQMDNISSSIADYCMDLLDNDYWRPHLLDTVCYGHFPFVLMLIEKGKIGKWLNSRDNEVVDRALWLLGSVAEKAPDNVTELLAPLVEKGPEWASRILYTICRKLTDDSDSMFELRLRLARSGIISYYIDWKDVCEKHPIRAIKLIEAILSTLGSACRDEQSASKRRHIEEWTHEDLKALSPVAKQYSMEAWEMLMPHVERLTSFMNSPYDQELEKWQKDSIFHGTLHMERGLVELLIKAGQKLAEENPEFMLEKTKKLNYSSSIIIQEILIKAYACLPNEYSDTGIRWLLEDFSRLHLGDGTSEPKWMPAVRLIKVLSPYCSEALFEKLEQSLIHYHDSDEKHLAKYYLSGWKKGYFDHYWGKAQYFLLPALSPDRISKTTSDLIKVLERKFLEYPKWRFLRIGPSGGGFIGSKLDKSLDKISDRAWLKIIGNKEIPIEDHWNYQQVKEDYAVESSIRQFSRSLGRIAKRYPGRFGQLALHFPKETHPHYVSAILNALALTKPDSEVPEEEKANWEPTSVDTVLAVWERFCNLDLNEYEVAESFCRLIGNRSAEAWPDRVIEKLLYLAVNHSDLEPGKLNICCNKSAEEATVETLFQNTINCVRGVAVEAIGQLLWEHPDWLDKLKSGIESLVMDPHPVVRMAAIYSLLPVLNIDSGQAVAWFCKAAKEDERISASRHAISFFNYTINKYTEQLTPLIQKMVYSDLPDVSNTGAEAVTAYHLFHGLFEDEFKDCIVGSVPLRKGVAKIAATFINEEKYASKCRELLVDFFDDCDEDVRNETSRMFGDKFFEFPENLTVAKLYINSKAFIDNSFILHLLEKHKESLVPYHDIILKFCQTISTTLLEEARDVQTRMGYVINAISPLLLRLYEQAQESKPDIAYRCLDAWDLLFEERVGNTRVLTKEIEK